MRRRIASCLRATSLCVLLVCALPVSARADALSTLPPTWRDKMQALPEIDVSAADRNAQEAIGVARARIDALLNDEQADVKRLAEATARLCALYQLVKIDTAAAQCWDSVRTLAPEDYRWAYYAGYLALTRGQSDAALELLTTARRLNPGYAPVDLRMGQVLLDTNALDQARAALERAAGTPGLRAAALYYLGQIDLLQQDYAAAEGHLSEALTLNPKGVEAHYPLAQAYRHLGQEVQAREHLALFKPGKPSTDDPLVAELNQVLAPANRDFYEGMLAVRKQDFAAAVAHFEAGLKADPANAAARVSYARALFLNGQTDAARGQLDWILAREPDHLQANLFMGVLLQSQGRNEEAAARYRRVIQVEPANAGAHFFLANLMFNDKQYAQAAQQYAAALGGEDSIPPARLLQPIALRRAGHPDSEVARMLEQRIDKHPEQVELQYAMILLRALSRDSAVRDTGRAFEAANKLATAQPMPPLLEAQAAAAAAAGHFEDAARVQQQLISRLTWQVSPQQMQALRDALAAYQKGKAPERDAWPESDPMLGSGPFDGTALFRDYPVAKPY